MKAPSPAFSLYPKDMLSDEQCAAMTNEEFGCYVRLLCHAWLEGSVPADPARLQRILKLRPQTFSKVWPAIAPCFEETDSRLYQLRLEKEREKQRERSESQATKGAARSKQRWGGTVPGTRSERLANARAIGTHTPREWEGLRAVTGKRCLRCSEPEAGLFGGELTKDHIVLISHGGSDAIENIQPLCRNCNSSKGADSKDLRPRDWKKRLAGWLETGSLPSPSPSPSPSPETATTEKQIAVAAAPAPPFKSARAVDIYRRFYPDGEPSPVMFKVLRPLVLKHGWDVVEPEMVAFLGQSNTTFRSWPKFGEGFGTWTIGPPGNVNGARKVTDKERRSTERALRLAGLGVAVDASQQRDMGPRDVGTGATALARRGQGDGEPPRGSLPPGTAAVPDGPPVAARRE